MPFTTHRVLFSELRPTLLHSVFINYIVTYILVRVEWNFSIERLWNLLLNGKTSFLSHIVEHYETGFSLTLSTQACSVTTSQICIEMSCIHEWVDRSYGMWMNQLQESLIRIIVLHEIIISKQVKWISHPRLFWLLAYRWRLWVMGREWAESRRVARSVFGLFSRAGPTH